ncbi:MAG: hypothetical protein IJJ26_09755 [Victivallales bacterium]|nr:hypothetical protein [Victivallales bacterium]
MKLFFTKYYGVNWLQQIAGKKSTPRSQKMAVDITCVNNLKQLALAFHMYTMDNSDTLPTADNWQTVLKEYLGDAFATIITCPKTKNVYHYCLNGQKLHDFQNPSRVIAFYDDIGAHNDSICIAFLDGHVQIVKLNGAQTIEELAQQEGFILQK